MVPLNFKWIISIDTFVLTTKNMARPYVAIGSDIRCTRPGFEQLIQAHAVSPTQAKVALRAADIPASTPLALIAPEFDAAYYLANNEDVRLSDMQPLEHFMLHGAAEMRNPNAWFDVGYYLRTNSDLVVADVNPFWHYLAHGRGEGRKPAPERLAERATLADAVPANARWAAGQPFEAPPLAPGPLRAAISCCLPGTAGLSVSVSHDRYTHSVGGVQILVSDEQAAFSFRNETYVHIAPAAPRLMLAPADESPFLLHLTINGAYIGLTTYGDLAQAIVELAPELPGLRRFIVHCLFGHQVEPLITLYQALRSATAVFWANDYEAICVGYNLLRNDISYCGGPPAGSMACRVCIYGEDRDAHLAQLGRLFGSVPFHVVAPSQAALALWNNAAHLPHRSAQVHEYARIRPIASRNGLIGATSRGTADNPVRIAFVGYPAPHKGWPGFVEVVAAINGLVAYQAYHFTALPADPPLPNVETVLTKVLPGARGAMTDALVAYSIDLVLVLSAWPETFCLVAYEALAAGADVIALSSGGNVADMVLASGRGLVMSDIGAVIEFLTNDIAVEYVRMCGHQGSDMGRLESRGMTATLALPDALPDMRSEAAA